MRNLIIAIALLVFVVIPLAVMKYGDDTQEGYVQVTYLANGLSMASEFKAHIGEYYYDTGKFPADNSEIRMPQPDSFSSDAVRSIEVQNGRIVTTYTELTGVDGGTIYLIPESVGNLMKWRCETTSYPSINEYMPQCHYAEKKGTHLFFSTPKQQFPFWSLSRSY